jgi:hypothetical protein
VGVCDGEFPTISAPALRYHPVMPDDDTIEIPFDSPDADLTYAHNLETCRRAGVTPVSREQALGLIQEWTEVLSGRPEQTQQ